MAQIVIGTAGHIDHGKTALVKALTGTDTDRLEEEQARGMTIDLGFAFLNDQVTIIDVPGHERFIRNMVAGVATIQVALLVVAADDGIMPQTREHVQILSHLGIPRGIIALTKIDLVDDPDWLDLVELEIAELVKGTFLKSAPVIRTAVHPEQGIGELKRALLEVAAGVPEAYDRGFFCLPVDRVFSKKGFGVIVTGTVSSGALGVGAEVAILPAGTRVKVRGLQSHGREVEGVRMGDRAALNLSGVHRKELWRGSVLAEAGWLPVTRRIIARLELNRGTPWELKEGQRIRLHRGTAEVLARVSLTGVKRLKAGCGTNGILKLEKPLAAAMDDRFVIRSYSPLETIGGGVVLDPDPPGGPPAGGPGGGKVSSSNWRTGDGRGWREWVRDLAPDPAHRLRQFVQQRWKRPLSIDQWSRRFQRTPQSIAALREVGKLEEHNGLLFSEEKWDQARNAILELLDRFHREHPYQKALSGEVIRSGLEVDPQWFEMVLASLLEEGRIEARSGGYAQADHQVILKPEDERQAGRVARLLRQTGYKLAAVNELARELQLEEKKILQLLHLLKDRRETEEVTPGNWIDSRLLGTLEKDLAAYFKSHAKLLVSDFKNLTATTRKAAIPLLEYCDRRNWTERSGNERLPGEDLP